MSEETLAAPPSVMAPGLHAEIAALIDDWHKEIFGGGDIEPRVWENYSRAKTKFTANLFELLEGK